MPNSVEIWKPIPGWEGLYEASSGGRVRSLDRITNGSQGSKRLTKGRVLSPGLTKHGYQIVVLKRTGEKGISSAVHRLVCTAFHGIGDGLDAAHGDGNRTNNRADNLRWATRSENHSDKLLHGTMNCGTRHHNAKLDPDKVRSIRSLAATGEVFSVIAKRFGIDQSNVSYVVRRKTWTHI